MYEEGVADRKVEGDVMEVLTGTAALNFCLEFYGGSLDLEGKVEYKDETDQPETFEGKFKLQMHGGIILYKEGKSTMTILPSSVIQVRGRRHVPGQDLTVEWDPQTGHFEETVMDY